MNNTNSAQIERTAQELLQKCNNILEKNLRSFLRKKIEDAKKEIEEGLKKYTENRDKELADISKERVGKEDDSSLTELYDDWEKSVIYSYKTGVEALVAIWGNFIEACEREMK